MYGKKEEFKTLIEQYNCDICCISESWERDSLALSDIISIENFKFVTNVTKRSGRGGKPAILINESKYVIKELCPNDITVPLNVEAVWALIQCKNISQMSQFKNIIVCSYYYAGPHTASKEAIYDHMTESISYLSAKYGPKVDFILCADSNRLDLSPIIDSSADLCQVVKVPTRLNPPATLDTIVTSLSKYYEEPVTKPPIMNDSSSSGTPSDHLIVLWKPISNNCELSQRVYRTVVNRPISPIGVSKFSEWLKNKSWHDIYQCNDIHQKASKFQEMLLEKYYECFPEKIFKVSDDDKPWVTHQIKALDRQRKREYAKNQKSPKWIKLNDVFNQKVKLAKSTYRNKIVDDLKTSHSSQWYSKVKRMSGISSNKSQDYVENLANLPVQHQAEKLVNYFSSTRNKFEPIMKEHYSDYFSEQNLSRCSENFISPDDIIQVFSQINKKSATVKNDIPMKLLFQFSNDISIPLCHIINSMFESGDYPNLWKNEFITPIPKVFPSKTESDLRPISGVLNFAKVADKIISSYIIQDMEPYRDPSQYGNEKGLSINHLLIKMLHQILKAVDNNSASDKKAVILNMIDWSKAFENQSHQLGVDSFIRNGVRQSLIPLLVNFFSDRKLQVKWNKNYSSSKIVNGGGPQGITAGILEYLSQSNGNFDFLHNDDIFKYIDDASFMEIINLLSIGISSFNSKITIPTDIVDHYIPPQNLKSSDHINKISEWSDINKMALNTDKTKYMIINFCSSLQFQTRLYLKNTLLSQVKQTKLLGVIIADDLSWSANTACIIKKAYKRMIILKKLYEFQVSIPDLIHIYIIYIRSTLEQNSVVWSSSITCTESDALERVQKCALRIILKSEYIEYTNALSVTNIPTLVKRRENLLQRFAIKCASNPKTSQMFEVNKKPTNLRYTEFYKVPRANTSRYANSAIPTMARLLNKHKITNVTDIT